MELSGAHVVITGASRGIGAALADAFAAKGATLTLVARSVENLTTVAERTGGNVVPADLADPAVVAGLIARIEAEHGPVDVLVNNAGIDAAGGFVDMDPADLERLVRLNCITVAELSRQVLPGMVERGRGHIVQLSSLAGTGVFPGISAYSATKAFVSHLSFGIRMELQGLPVGVTVVEPGLVVPTDMADGVLEYRPTDASFKRFYRLGLLADVKVTKLADATVRAVETGKHNVRLPRRAVLFPLITGFPRNLANALLAGVPRRAE